MARAVVAIIVGLVMAALPALANVDGIFVCTTVNDAQTSCVAYSEITGGTATFGDLGLTANTIAYAIMFGLGLVLGPFAIGSALGACRRLLDGFFGGNTLQ